MKEESKPEAATPKDPKDEPRAEKPRRREAEGTWANLIRVRMRAKGPLA